LPGTALARHRARQRRAGLLRVEVQASGDDAVLIRAVASALADPARAQAARALLRARLAPEPGLDLKALLEAAPLDGIELTRSRDPGREVDL
jgi:hypothetical protein